MSRTVRNIINCYLRFDPYLGDLTPFETEYKPRRMQVCHVFPALSYHMSRPSHWECTLGTVVRISSLALMINE